MDISSVVNDSPPTTTNGNGTASNGNATASNADQPALLDAIDSANLYRVRTVLREICIANPEAFQIACNELLVGHGQPSSKDDTRAGTKRKHDPPQQRYEICEQCKEEYDVLDNPEDACVWHSGRSEPDYDGDSWADHDENCHGIIDSEEMREEFPDGFIYNCCNKRGDEDGCKVGKHAPDLRRRSKRRA